MNTSGLLQSQSEARNVHHSLNIPKIEFISYKFPFSQKAYYESLDFGNVHSLMNLTD